MAKGPRMAVTLSSWINLVAATTPFWASEPSSAMMNSIGRPSMPPAALRSLSSSLSASITSELAAAAIPVAE